MRDALLPALAKLTAFTVSASIQESVDESDVVLVKKIGNGSFGDVWLAESDTYGEVAVKVVTPAPNRNMDDMLQAFQKEVDIMKQLRHPNILLFLAAGRLHTGVCLIMGASCCVAI